MSTGNIKTTRRVAALTPARSSSASTPNSPKLVEDLSDEQIRQLRRGGHDPVKVYNGFKRALEHKGQPTVILCKTVKGYGLGEAGEGKNITHQQKKLNEERAVLFIQRFDLNLTPETVHAVSFVAPKKTAPNSSTCGNGAKRSAGICLARNPKKIELKAPPLESFSEALGGSRGREASTTTAFVSVLKSLLKAADLGKYVVPIVPDEARTFGMESMFRERGIYAPAASCTSRSTATF